MNHNPNQFPILLLLQLLQNLGKVDRTADEIFDEHLTNFNRQQNNAARLQKEFNNYIRCVRGELPSHKIDLLTIITCIHSPLQRYKRLQSR